jgi:putative membrane protein
MIKLLIGWAVSAASLLIVAYLLPGIHVSGIKAAFIAAFVIGLVNATLGRVIKFLTFPISVVTLGLFWLVINAVMLLIAARLVDGFRIDGFIPAVLGSVLLTVVNWLLRKILGEPGKRD